MKKYTDLEKLEYYSKRINDYSLSEGERSKARSRCNSLRRKLDSKLYKINRVDGQMIVESDSESFLWFLKKNINRKRKNHLNDQSKHRLNQSSILIPYYMENDIDDMISSAKRVNDYNLKNNPFVDRK